MAADDAGDNELALEVGSGVAGAAVGLVGGPAGAVAGAVAGPLVARGLRLITRWHEGREQNAADVLLRAADIAGIDPETLFDRLRSTDDRRELLFRALSAAEAAGHLDRLVALAQSLASAADDDQDLNLHWEKAFVAVVSDLDTPHFELLRRFTMTANQNNLGNGGPEFDDEVGALNDKQIELAMPGWDEVLPTLMSSLQSRGLVTAVATGGGGYGGAGGPRPTTWRISTFGRAVLDRFGTLGDALGDAPAPDQ